MKNPGLGARVELKHDLGAEAPTENRPNMKSNTYTHAQRELDILEKNVPDAIITPFREEILALTEKFGKSGQSGGSAPMTASAISAAVKKLLLQEPIGPLYGTDDEWNDITEMNSGEPMWQNNRDSRVFKHADDTVSFNDAIVKRTENDPCYSGSLWLTREDYIAGRKENRISSSQLVKSFPFTPKTFYIDVVEEEVAPDDWEMYVKNPTQLEEVWKYYDRRNTN